MKENRHEDLNKVSEKLEEKESNPVLKETPDASEEKNSLTLVEEEKQKTREQQKPKIERESDPEEESSSPPPTNLLEKYKLPGLVIPLVSMMLFLLSFISMGTVSQMSILGSMLLTASWWAWCSVKYQRIAIDAFPEESKKYLLSTGSLILFRIFYIAVILLVVLGLLPKSEVNNLDTWAPQWMIIARVAIAFFWIVFEILWYSSMESFIATMKAKPEGQIRLGIPMLRTLGYVLSNTIGLLIYPVFVPIFANNLRSRFTEILKKDYSIKGNFDDKSRKTIRYRRFATIEKWITQRFTSGKKDKHRKVKFAVAVLLAPVLIALGFYGSIQFYDLLSSIIAQIFGGGADDGSLPQTASNNISIISGFLIAFGTSIWTMTMVYFLSPNYVEFSKKGIRFLRKSEESVREIKLIPWEQIEKITIESESVGGSDGVLYFHKKTGGKPEKLKLNSVPTIEERQDILTAIERFAPDIHRTSDVILALQLPAEHSYTELWLQALAAPPKREKLQPLTPGLSLRDGRYEVIRKLGAGGQGFAYLAKDTNSDEVVVLKEFILPVFVDINVRKAALEAFEGEARILGNLDHPQIVKLLDFMVEDHRAYLVLEHIDGKSLRELVKENGPLQEDTVRDLAKQMCTVLKDLHSQSPPVVHRDFTPDNLILKKDGTLKLIDFNVAQQSDSTTIAKVVGKQAYLPPEQFRGEPCPQSDIYAMGCTLHYLTTGEDPVPISQSKPRSIKPDLSYNFDEIVAGCTEIKLERRYSDLDKIVEDLEKRDEGDQEPPAEKETGERKSAPIKEEVRSKPEVKLKESEPVESLKVVPDKEPQSLVSSEPKPEPEPQVVAGTKKEKDLKERTRAVLEKLSKFSFIAFFVITLPVFAWLLIPGARPFLDPDYSYNKARFEARQIEREHLTRSYIQAESKIIDKFERPIDYYNRATAYYEIGEYEKAVQDLKKAINLKPEEDLYWHKLAQYHNAENNFSAARKTVDEALKSTKSWSSSRQAGLHYFRANANLQLPPHDSSESLKDLSLSNSKGRSLNRPRNTLRAIANEIKGDPDKAINNFKKAARERENWFWSTGIPHDTKLLRKIHLQILERATKTYSKRDAALFARALGLYQVRAYADAEASLNKLSENARQTEPVLSLEAQVQLAIGNLDRANELVNLALSKKPASGQANFIKGKLLFDQNRLREALPFLKVSLNSKSRYADEARLLRAKIFRSMGSLGLAMKDLREILKPNVSWPEADLLMGEIMYEQGRFQEVTKRYNRFFYEYRWLNGNWNFIGARMADLMARSYQNLNDMRSASKYRKIAEQLGFKPEIKFDRNKPGLF